MAIKTPKKSTAAILRASQRVNWEKFLGWRVNWIAAAAALWSTCMLTHYDNPYSVCACRRRRYQMVYKLQKRAVVSTRRPTPGESRPIPIAKVETLTQGLVLKFDLWPFDLRVSAYRGPTMDYMSINVGADSSSRFPFRARTNTQTDKQTRLNTLPHVGGNTAGEKASCLVQQRGQVGYWTTRGYANSRIAKSWTSQLAGWTSRGCRKFDAMFVTLMRNKLLRKRLELSPNLVHMYSIAVARHALTQRWKGQRSRSRSHGTKTVTAHSC